MVVKHINVEGVTATPAEADAVLIVDPHAVLSLPVALQGLKPIAREGPKILDLPRGVDLKELALRYPRDAAKSARGFAEEESLRVLASERPGHPVNV